MLFFGTIHPSRMQVLPERGMVTTAWLVMFSTNRPLPVVNASVRASTFIMVERLFTLMHRAGFFKDRI